MGEEALLIRCYVNTLFTLRLHEAELVHFEDVVLRDTEEHQLVIRRSAQWRLKRADPDFVDADGMLRRIDNRVPARGSVAFARVGATSPER